MRSRAGSWSLGLVLFLCVALIATGSGPGFLALAQGDGTPIIEEPGQEEQPPTELPSESPVPEPPTEIPIPPTEIPVIPTETPVPAIETPFPLTQAPALPTESVTPEATVTPTEDALVQAASEQTIPLDLSPCSLNTAWRIFLKLDQLSYPSSLTLNFASGASGVIAWANAYSAQADGYLVFYHAYDNMDEQLVSVSGAVSSDLNPRAILVNAPNCSLFVPPTVTPTPTLPGTTTLVSSFVDCSPDTSMWSFLLSTQGVLPDGASWPSTVNLAFASGAIGTATTFSETIGENTAQIEFRSLDNLSDALVSATLALPPGLTGTLELRYAPSCTPGALPTATATSSSTPTITPTATWEGGITTIYPDKSGCSPQPTGWTYFLSISAPPEVIQRLTLPATITYGNGTTASMSPSDSWTEESPSIPGYLMYQALYRLPPTTALPFTLSIDVPATFSEEREFQIWNGPTCDTNASPTPTSTPILLSYSATFDDCVTNTRLWNFRLAYPGPLSALPESILVLFSSGDRVTVNQTETFMQDGRAVGTYLLSSHQRDHVVVASALAPHSDQQVIFQVRAGNCSPGVYGQATTTPTPGITLTPTRTSTPWAVIPMSLADCLATGEQQWFFTLYLDGHPSLIPETIEMTFASGATASVPLADSGTHEGRAFGIYIFDRFYSPVQERLASAEAHTYPGVTGVLYLTIAPTCDPWVPTPSVTPSVTLTPTPTLTTTPTITLTPTITRTPTIVPVDVQMTPDFSLCEPLPDLWGVFVRSANPTFPAEILLTFDDGSTVTAASAGIVSLIGQTYQKSYVSFEGTDRQLVSVTAAFPPGMSGTALVRNGPSCTPPAGPTETPTLTSTITETPTITGTPTTTPVIVQMTPDFSFCQPLPYLFWAVSVHMGDPAFPAEILLTFDDGSTATATSASEVSSIGPNYEMTFLSHQGTDRQLVSVTAALPPGMSGTALVRNGPSCTPPGGPTQTPTVTPTIPVWDGTTNSVSATFDRCITRPVWYFSMTVQGPLPIGASWPAEIELTFVGGETVLAPMVDDRSYLDPAEFDFAWEANLSDRLVSAVAQLPNGLTGELSLLIAPNCPYGSAATATHVPSETAIPSSTPTFAPTESPAATAPSTTTHTPTATETPSATATASATPPEIASSTPTEIPTETATATSTATETATAAPTETVTDTPTLVPAATDTPTASATATEIASNIPSATPSETATTLPPPTETATSQPTETATASSTATVVPTDTATETSTVTASATATVTATPSSTPTQLPSSTSTQTPAPTDVPTESATPSSTPTEEPTQMSTPTSTDTPSDTPTDTGTATNTPTGTATPTSTPTSIETATATATATFTPTLTVTPSSTATSVPTETATGTSTPTTALTEAASSTATASSSPSDKPTDPASATSTPTETATPSRTATASSTATATATSMALPTMLTTANVNCRTGASGSATSLGVVPRNTTLPVRGTASGGWIPVVCFGQNGWISSSYLTPVPTATATLPSGPSVTTTARVNCRTGASTSATVLGVVPARTSLAVRGSVQSGWTPVVCFGQQGWISSSYLTPVASATATVPSGPQAMTTTRVNCRTAPTTSQANVITVLGSGVTVPVRGSASGGWTPVVCGGQNGWVSSQYLRAA